MYKDFISKLDKDAAWQTLTWEIQASNLTFDK